MNVLSIRCEWLEEQSLLPTLRVFPAWILWRTGWQPSFYTGWWSSVPPACLSSAASWAEPCWFRKWTKRGPEDVEKNESAAGHIAAASFVQSPHVHFSLWGLTAFGMTSLQHQTAVMELQAVENGGKAWWAISRNVECWFFVATISLGSMHVEQDSSKSHMTWRESTGWPPLGSIWYTPTTCVEWWKEQSTTRS